MASTLAPKTTCPSSGSKVKLSDLFMSGINSSAARASVLGKGRCLRVLIFSWAFLFVIFAPWRSSMTEFSNLVNLWVFECNSSLTYWSYCYLVCLSCGFWAGSDIAEFKAWRRDTVMVYIQSNTEYKRQSYQVYHKHSPPSVWFPERLKRTMLSTISRKISFRVDQPG